MKLVLASKNQKKLVEMNEILSHLGIQVCSEAEAGVDVEVEVGLVNDGPFTILLDSETL